jgi:arylsulfatase A-like enzyme
VLLLVGVGAGLGCHQAAALDDAKPLGSGTVPRAPAAPSAAASSGSAPAGPTRPPSSQPPTLAVGAAPSSADTGVSHTVAHTTMDLLANRVHAASYVNDHLVVDAGTPDFLKYIDGGWKTAWLVDESDEGRPAALTLGLSSLMSLPGLDAGVGGGGGQIGVGVGVGVAVGDGGGGGGAAGGALARSPAVPVDAVVTFTARALAPGQRCTLFMNDRSLGTLDLDGGHGRRYEVKVPATVQRPGDNRLRFTFRSAATIAGKRSAAAFTQLTFGPASEPPPPPATRPVSVGSVALGGVARSALSLAVGTGATGSSRVSYFVQVPAAAHLVFAYGSASPGARAEVRLSSDRAPPRRLLEAAAGPSWTEADLPLVDPAADGPEAVRIDFISRGGTVRWASPRVVVRAPPTAPAPDPSSGKSSGQKIDNIFVWMVDTLRADKVRVNNPETRVQTPNYDAFAADATRFAWAQVPGTWSLPSHASLLTGVYPPVHKAIAHEARLSREVGFIAEELKKKGFKTALFSSNGYVSNKWGFDRGWDAYRNFIRENLPNGADYLWKTAKPWVLQNARRREFAYLATVEPHVAYTPRPEFLKKYWNKPYRGPLKPALTGVQLGLIGAGKLKIDDNDKAYLEALHDGEISQSDACFAVFIADLKAAHLYDRSAIIVVSDHGDEFGEHGRFGHGHSVYQELTHVPLIIRAPGRLPAGKVVRTDVEIMDLYPTMLDLAGVDLAALDLAGEHPGALIQGTSLVPLAWDDLPETPRAAMTIDGQTARGVKVGRYRLVAASGRLELYDELEDRLEQKDVAAARPIALRAMRGVLGVIHPYESRWSKSRWGSPANLAPAFARDLQRDLQTTQK